jgi:D-Tyr-tRNAtyr deacylase
LIFPLLPPILHENKKEIDRLERKLDKLKLIANETDEINAQIKQLEGLIKNYYNKKTEAAKIRSRVSQCHTCNYRLSF